MKYRVFAAVAAVLIAAPAVATEKVGLHFTVYVYGLKLGHLRVDMAQSGTNYTVRGRVNTTGLIAKIANFDFDGETKGVRDGPLYWPATYSATIFNKSRKSTVRMRYNDRTPEVLEYLPEKPARKYDVDPSQQIGTVDLVSSAYMILRDVPRDRLCDKSVQMFDGRRRSQIRLDPPQLTNDTATCRGIYQRIAGFSDGEMAEQTVFPFSLHYEMQSDESFRLMRVQTETIIGSAKLVRRE